MTDLANSLSKEIKILKKQCQQAVWEQKQKLEEIKAKKRATESLRNKQKDITDRYQYLKECFIKLRHDNDLMCKTSNRQLVRVDQQHRSTLRMCSKAKKLQLPRLQKARQAQKKIQSIKNFARVGARQEIKRELL